jgi:flagellar hook-length control protein FliK
LPAPQPVATEPAAPVQAPVAAASAVPAAPQPAAPAQTPAAPVATAPEAPAASPPANADAAAPAVPTAEESATPVPAAPVKTDDIKLPQASGTGAPQPQAATGAPAQPNAGDTGQPQQQPEQTAAPAPTPSTAPLAEAPKTDAPALPEAQPLQTQGPAAPAQPAAPLQRAVSLYRAPQVAAAVIHLAQSHGVTHARINLKPAELGGIEVRLHSSPQGISAHLIADSPEAAKALSQAGDDLRRQLEARDVTLLSLDVSTSGEDRREATFGADLGRDGSSGTPNGGPRRGAGDEQPAETPTVTTLVLPDGVLVDVLA